MTVMKYIISTMLIVFAFVAGTKYENWRINDNCLTQHRHLVDVYIIGVCGDLVK